MGMKLLWTGLTIIMAVEMFWPGAHLAGSIVMIIGAILMWLDK